MMLILDDNKWLLKLLEPFACHLRECGTARPPSASNMGPERSSRPLTLLSMLRRSSDIVGVLCGALALLVLLVMYLLAVSSDADYGLWDNYLSELGVGPGADYFNGGIICACSLGAVFALFGLRPALTPSISREVGVGLFLLACAFGILAGVYTMNDFEAHGIATWGTFVSLWTSLIFISYALHIDDPLGRRMTELSQSLVVAGVLLVVFGSNPLGEVLIVVLLGIWLVTFSYLRLVQVLRPGGTRSDPQGIPD